MRILCVTSTFPRWPGDDTTTFILHFAQELIAQGAQVHVLAPHAPNARRQEVIDGVPVERFRYMRPDSAEDICYQGGALFNIAGSPLTAAKLPALIGSQWGAIRRRVRSGKYDVISAHWLLPQGWTAVRASAGSGVPVVSTVHGSDVFGLSHPLLAKFKRAALAGSAAVTVNSTATREAVLGLGAPIRDLQLIPMGTDVTAVANESLVRQWRERYRRGNGPLVVFVGRLIDWKGVDVLLDAAAFAVKDLPELQVVIAGSGPLREQLEHRSTELGLSERVHFVGWLAREDVTALQAAADIVAVPSRTAADGSREAQGLSVVEAMALGTPVIASRAGGIPDAITDGENGLLVPEADPQALANAIVRLAGDPELAAKLGAAAHESAQRYSWPACAARFLEVFDSVAKKG